MVKIVFWSLVSVFLKAKLHLESAGCTLWCYVIDSIANFTRIDLFDCPPQVANGSSWFENTWFHPPPPKVTVAIISPTFWWLKISNVMELYLSDFPSLPIQRFFLVYWVGSYWRWSNREKACIWLNTDVNLGLRLQYTMAVSMARAIFYGFIMPL